MDDQRNYPATRQMAELAIAWSTVHTPDEWKEEDGAVLWWHFPVCEPPVVGSHECMGETLNGEPSWCAKAQRDGWLTHWSRIPIVWDKHGMPLDDKRGVAPNIAIRLGLDEMKRLGSIAPKMIDGPNPPGGQEE